MTNLDWATAKMRLDSEVAAYKHLKSTDTIPYLAFVVVIRPLVERYARGERTQGLYDNIMALE